MKLTECSLWLLSVLLIMCRLLVCSHCWLVPPIVLIWFMAIMFVVSVVLIFISDNCFFPVNTLFDKVCRHWLFCQLCWQVLLSPLVPPAMMMMLATAGCAWWGCLPSLVLLAVVMGFVVTAHPIDCFDEVCCHYFFCCEMCWQSMQPPFDEVCSHCSFRRSCGQSVQPQIKQVLLHRHQIFWPPHIQYWNIVTEITCNVSLLVCKCLYNTIYNSTMKILEDA